VTVLLLLPCSQPGGASAGDRSLQAGPPFKLHLIYENCLWGYVDNDGRVVIKPQFLQADEFFEGRAAVSKQNEAGYIQPDGSPSVVLPKDSFPARDFSEGLAWFAKGGRFGCIDLEGKVVIPPTYDGCQGFSEGLAVVCMNRNLKSDPFNPELDPKLFGYMDRNGRVVIPLRYGSAHSFHDGLARTDEGYIDRTGKVAISLRDFSSDPDLYVATATDYSNGRAVIVLDSKTGRPSKRVLLDTKGGRVATLRCDGLGHFSEGLAKIYINDKIGYIDESGKITIPANFDSGSDFHEGLCLVRVGDELQYIDKTGAAIARGGQKGSEVWNDAEDFRDGLARVHIGGTLMERLHDPWWWKGGKWCYVDRTGRIVCICRIDGNKSIEPSFGLRLR
jgi:WG containing repeat